MLDPKSPMEDLESDLSNYTGGRFLVNEALRLWERRRGFDIPGLFAAVRENYQVQALDFRKLGEGRPEPLDH
ncbi:hypothetical protein B0H16DRAFT_1567145 [Mycena metata]|uniref:Uncharacterized protein n=1 Tax=Mycena metata TaxID=1033252 RepID=A0AAD7N0I5_9AGAR|nr:hypothetical protein B0H16DRAFT_1567145 [Mycena metata]